MTLVHVVVARNIKGVMENEIYKIRYIHEVVDKITFDDDEIKITLYLE